MIFINHDDALDLSKEESDELLDLRKQYVEELCLKKPSLEGLTARFAVALDESGSMYDWYKDGSIQKLLNKLLPVAMNLNQKKEMDLWLFANSSRRCTPISRENYYGYVRRNIGLPSGRLTNYAPVIQDIFQKYVKEDPLLTPTYILFITDGDNNDKERTTEWIKKISQYPIFFQFIGIGHYSFSYLEMLDTMNGRYVDNANFASCNEMIFDDNSMSDMEIYNILLREYPLWLQLPRVKRMLNGLPPERSLLSSLLRFFQK